MTFEVTHKKIVATPDVPTTSMVRPTDWNNSHKIIISAGVVGRRPETGNGEPELLPIYVDALGNVQFDMTGSALLPKGTTGQRSDPPSDGMIRYNTTTLRVEAYVNGVWVDLVTSSDWKVPTGTYIYTFAKGAKPGWVEAFGEIGHPDSGAGNRANLDTLDLYVMLWETYPDSFVAVAGGRGASAEEDFFALKKLMLPDLREQVVAAGSNLGEADMIPGWEISNDKLKDGPTGGFGAVVDIGTAAGTKGHQLTVDELAAHSHELPDTPSTDTPSTASVAGAPWFGNTTVSTAETGGDDAHNNVQPTVLLNALIKL